MRLYFDITQPAQGLFPRLAQCLFFWNPLICSFFTVLFPWQGHWLLGWLTSLSISSTISMLCFFGVDLVRRLERAFCRATGRSAPVHQKGWYIALSVLIMLPGMQLGFAVGGAFRRWAGVPWTSPPSFDDYKTGALWGISIALLMFLWETRRDARLQVQQLEKKRLQAQVSALTAQMNPHLLFNALNTVASMIPTDPRAAEETVVRLSQLYRGVLSSSQGATHSLERELEICESYLAVEKARFGPRLSVSVEIDPAIDRSKVQIPALLLQPMVENAVKHGLSSRKEGGAIRLSAQARGGSLELHVDDDGVGLGNSPKAGSGSALRNCRDRLALLYGDKAKFELQSREGGGTRVWMELPV